MISIPVTPRNQDELSGLASVKVVESKINERKQEIEFQHETYWQSCCGCQIDRRIMNFFVTSVVSFTSLLFCMYMIATAKKGDCTCETEDDDVTIFWGLLSSIVGAYLGPTIINGGSNKK